MKNQDVIMNLFLLRHGATAGNKEYRYIGWTDEPLSEEGTAGIREVCKQLDTVPVLRADSDKSPDLLVVSPMTRCRQTAALIWPERPQIIIDNLKEMNFGRFEGKNYQDLNGTPDYQAWIDSNGTIAFPEGEDRNQFIRRSMDGFAQLLKLVQESANRESTLEFENSAMQVEEHKRQTMQMEVRRRQTMPAEEYKRQTIPVPEGRGISGSITAVAVVHGGTIMAIMSSLTSEDYFSFQVKNGQGYQLKLLLKNQGATSQEISILNELLLLEYEKI